MRETTSPLREDMTVPSTKPAPEDLELNRSTTLDIKTQNSTTDTSKTTNSSKRTLNSM